MRHMNRVVIAGILILNVVFSPLSVNPSTIATQSHGFGKVHFANSCSTEVQMDFDAAIAMLHSFQYGLAEKAFTQVAQKDSQCAIAYWGAAMTLYRQLWDWPDEKSIQKGREYLRQAGLALKKDERENAYVNAAVAFFQPEQSLGRASRSQAYSRAMMHLYQRYPQDGDATAFYALSLLTLPAQGPDPEANQRKATAILQKLFAEQPEHPGAAHYLIHAADTPDLAPLGLPAALRYAQIAPSSPHALHMPSHIFVRLGMWQESIASNATSLAAAEKASKSQRDDGSGDALHAIMYLTYSYLQSGQDEEARRVLEHINSVEGATASDIANNLSILESLYAVETHDWKQAASLGLRSGVFPYARMRVYWARSIGAARTGNVASARDSLEKLNEARASMLAYMRTVDGRMNTGHCGSHNSDVSVQQLEAEAWLAWAEGKSAEALHLMRLAANKEEFFGVESRTVPAYEMLGDLLLELHQPEPALAAYATALKAAPGRLNTVVGAARAARATGDREQARSYYAMFLTCCSPLTMRLELAEAKLFLGTD